MTDTAAPLALTTDRLVLRRWRPEDRAPFAAMNADAEVMEFFPSPLTREASDALADRIEAHFDRRGFGVWAVEIPRVTAFAGFVGLAEVGFDAHFTPAVEIGWRLDRRCWGRGFATEAARTALTYGFRELGLTEVVSFAVVDNHRSRSVMERLGMRHDPRDDFDHPKLVDERHRRWRRHVLYRVAAGDWR